MATHITLAKRTEIASLPRPNRSRDRRRGGRAFGMLSSTALIVVTALFMVPILFTLSSAFRPAADVAANPIGLPRRFTTDNFAAVFGQIHYARSVFNTVVLMLGSSLVIVAAGAMAGYPLARVTSKWPAWVYRFFIIGLSVPVFVLITPLFLLMRDLKLLDRPFISVVLIYSAANIPLAVFFFTSFIRQIPTELEEAASVDGSGTFRTFFTIILPLLKPVTATLLTFVSLAIWNDLLVPLVFVSEPSERTVMVNAYSFLDPKIIEPTVLFPAALLGIAPLLIIFALFQRQMVQGLSAGAVKG